uniref:ABC transmembrane type-1 domain-containing protein n=1 Tax=Parascaris univalens TaxID=6257 RepID=A0A915BTH0_PARUN
SEGPHSLTLTINNHSDEEKSKTCDKHIESQFLQTDSTVDRAEEKLTRNYRHRGFCTNLRLFLHLVCEDGSRMVMLLLFSIICALLSGCCLSSTIVFTGRIKHVLLTHAPKTEGFRMRTFEQVYILASLTAFAIVANFCTYMTSNFFGNKVVLNLRKKYVSCAEKICSNEHLQNDINNELNEKIQHIHSGSENIAALSRSMAIVIASSFISFYHEFRLTLVMLALNQLLDGILRGKAARAAHMEKELLLLSGIDERSYGDERLLRLSDVLHGATRYGIMKEGWNGCYSGIMCFLVFTAVGCGMLYGGYLLEKNIVVRQGDIFIVVLSIALLANTTGAITSQWRSFMNGVNAANYIKKLEKLELDKANSKSLQKIFTRNEIAVTDLSKMNVSKLSIDHPSCKSNRKIAFFTNGTNKVLKNNHHDRLYMAFGFMLAAVHGLELPAYNVIMGGVFLAMLEPRTDMMHKLFYTMLIFTFTGFAILIARTISGVLSGIVSEHISVGLRVNLVRHHARPQMACKKFDVEDVVKDDASKATNAKSFFHPHATRLVSDAVSILLNIIIGFIFSWEVALIGTIFILICFIIQLKIANSTDGNKYAKLNQKKGKDEKVEGWEIPFTTNIPLAINYSLMQTSGFIIQTICYALTAYIVSNGYKYPNEAFMSVIAMNGALQRIILFPALFKQISKSCSSAHHIFTLIHSMPSSSKTAVYPA